MMKKDFAIIINLALAIVKTDNICYNLDIDIIYSSQNLKGASPL